MKSLPLFFITLFFLQTISYGQTKEDKLLEKRLDALLSPQFEPAAPGCVVLVAKKGEIVYNKAFGAANIELNVPLRTDMVFRIGSVTKQFTAVAILQLVEQGKLSLQDSIQKYIKDYPSKGHIITIEHLLTHTSGIKDYLQINYSSPFLERWDFTPKQLIDSFKNVPMEFAPGAKFSYSNSGYALLGYIIEKVSGMYFQDYMQQNLFKPLGLSNTFCDNAGSIIPKRVNGYVKEVQGYKNADYWSMTVAYSAGSMVSCVEDLLKWHTALHSYKILKKETLDKAFTSFMLKDGTPAEYGYGWFLKQVNGTRSIAHGGAISGFRSNALYYPAEDVFIAVLFNCGCARVDELSLAISGLALGRPMQTDIKVSDAVLNACTGTYYLVSNPKRTIVLTKENDHLLAMISGQGSFPLLFQSDTKFQFKNVADAQCEFVYENGKVTKMVVNQNGVYEWKKKE